MAVFILEQHRGWPKGWKNTHRELYQDIANVLARKIELEEIMASDFVECERWIRFKPVFNPRGDLVGAEVEGMTKGPPKEHGPTVKVTFKIPKRVFGPMANVTVDLDSAAFDGTPEVVAESLKELRDSLK